MFINSEWCAAVSGKTFDVTNPANGEKIADVPDGGQADAEGAIQAAHDAFAGWSGMTAYERSRILYKAYELMSARKEDIARTMTTEQGKPLRAAMNEAALSAAVPLFVNVGAPLLLSFGSNGLFSAKNARPV